MSTCPIIAIDPGNAQSGYCVIDRNTLRPLEFGKVDNAELLRKLASATEQGLAVGGHRDGGLLRNVGRPGGVRYRPLDRPFLPSP